MYATLHYPDTSTNTRSFSSFQLHSHGEEEERRKKNQEEEEEEEEEKERKKNIIIIITTSIMTNARSSITHHLVHPTFILFIIPQLAQPFPPCLAAG